MRLIDADEALSKVKPYEASDEEWCVTGGTAIRLIHNTIDNTPTIDATPVVRCENCKHHDEEENYIYCWALHMRCPDDSEFFCKYGERKETEY